jgi:hypothetical protein
MALVHAPSTAIRQPQSDGHTSAFMPSSAQDLDAVDLSVVLDGGELDGERSIAGRGLGERLCHVAGSGRYIRMYGTARATQYGYSIYEFQVYPS